MHSATTESTDVATVPTCTNNFYSQLIALLLTMKLKPQEKKYKFMRMHTMMLVIKYGHYGKCNGSIILKKYYTPTFTTLA